VKKRLAAILALVTITLFFPVWLCGQQARAADINILPYYVVGNVGDYWTYSFISPSGISDFTVNLTKVTSGSLAGKYRYGDFVDIIESPYLNWRIADWDAGGINIYELSGKVFSPPFRIDAVQPLDALVYPFPDSAEHVHVFQKLASLTVIGGTFDDILVHITLDKHFGPSSANAEFGLDPVAFPYQVTHVEWLAARIGEIQNRDYEHAEGGKMLFEYQLKATSVTKHSFNPAIPMLLLDGNGQ
jgi:hypothetical protein